MQKVLKYRIRNILALLSWLSGETSKPAALALTDVSDRWN